MGDDDDGVDTHVYPFLPTPRNIGGYEEFAHKKLKELFQLLDSENNWETFGPKNSRVSIMSCPTESSGIHLVKLGGVIRGKGIKFILQKSLDSEFIRACDPHILQFDLIEDISDNLHIIYHTVKLPWPFSHREMWVLSCEMYKRGKDGNPEAIPIDLRKLMNGNEREQKILDDLLKENKDPLYFLLTSINRWGEPERKGHVRGVDHLVGFIFTPHPEGVHLTRLFQTDLKGNVPASVVNMMKSKVAVKLEALWDFLENICMAADEDENKGDS